MRAIRQEGAKSMWIPRLLLDHLAVVAVVKARFFKEMMINLVGKERGMSSSVIHPALVVRDVSIDKGS